MEHKTISSMIGMADNLHEPIPLANKPATILGVSISLQILAWFCGLLRLWTRLRVMRAPGWDDLFVAISLVTTTVGTIIVCLGGTSYGLGKHFLLLGSKQAMQDFFKGFYVANATYLMSTTFIKLALLFQYLRVFDRGTFQYRFSIGMIVFVALWGTAYSLIAWFPCSPISAYWSLNPDANCWGFASQNPTTFHITFETHSAINMILDLIVLSIPVPLYFKSGVQSKTRWGLTGLLFLGALANFASIWRLVTIVKTNAATKPTFDPSWYACISIILAATEVDMAVVCASVPVFWPVIQDAGFQIFITREIEITSESRLGSRDGGDGLGLHGAGEMPAGVSDPEMTTGIGGKGRPASLRSDSTLRNVSTSRSSGDKRNPDCFNDSFALNDLEPTRTRAQPGTEVSVSSNNHMVRTTQLDRDGKEFF